LFTVTSVGFPAAELALLLRRCLARFLQCRQPHWADPLKAWGDVLAKQGKTRDARAKYEEALKYAPNWAATATIADIAGAREAEVRPTILDHRGQSCSTVTLHDIEDGILAEPKPMTDFPV
jgi:hypothetical protein